MDIDILFVALFQTKISYPLSFTDWLCLHPVSDHYLHEVRRSHSLCLTRSFQKWCIMATAKDTWACGDNTGCWGRWFAWPGLCDLQQHRICKARAMGFGMGTGSMGTGRHGEDARDEAGSGKLASLRSMVSMTHFAAPQIQQYLSPHSHAELYLVLDLWTDNKHFITFLWFLFFYTLYHCSPAFCYLGAWDLMRHKAWDRQ